PLSVTMVLFVTGVGSLIHLYSIGYMHGQERFTRFFTYLNMFAFAMLVLVLAGNYLLVFLGWEGVGLCSYLLITFWFERPSRARPPATSWPGSVPSPPSSPPPSPSSTSTSSGCWRTPPSASWATCSWPSASAPTPPPSSTWSPTPSSRPSCSSAPVR